MENYSSLKVSQQFKGGFICNIHCHICLNFHSHGQLQEQKHEFDCVTPLTKCWEIKLVPLTLYRSMHALYLHLISTLCKIQ